MAKAVRYSLNHWGALTLVIRDGRACIDNSAAECAMRPVVVQLFLDQACAEAMLDTPFACSPMFDLRDDWTQ